MKKILLVLSIISLLYIGLNFKEEENIIPDEAIRFRVVANSNTVYDQNIKMQVRNTIQNKLFSLINESKSLNETRKIIMEHEQELHDEVRNKLKELKYDKNFNVSYGYNHFPEKKYKGITYKEGNYESLVITLGEGKGDNFWCVLFPPLCLLESDESSASDVEYKFFIKDFIDKYIKK